ALTLMTDGAVTTFEQPVGDLAPLASLLADAGGTTVLKGGRVTTAGGQTYADNVIVPGAGSTLASKGGGAIDFKNTVNGTGALAVSTSGAITFEKAVGAPSGPTLTSLTTGGGGTTALNGGAVTTTLNQV